VNTDYLHLKTDTELRELIEQIRRILEARKVKPHSKRKMYYNAGRWEARV
jgi:hypothetical protein